MSTLYEESIRRLLDEKRRRLEEVARAGDSPDEVARLEHEIHVLEMLYENYSSSMSAFRRTKGARKIH
ncbi:MAG: hypothetical protein RMJ59_04495 [Candidatus Nitrosocaldus sp.]|nr:hypothetical protein [Candidatus Nitrosocaldus sp.]MCS7141224.1 hypothetical protein [Candidatus Nitrosocaldus sp.]MDW8000170.1 hypothetical protein [Candidatus Nitrosocaldus sp.]MDW8275624.1 hypothetical protein [Candidatus Nitrosocaldus sp.]